MEGEEWYFIRDGQQVGPVSFTDLRNEWNHNTIDKETYVWCSLMENWQPIVEYPDLLAKLNPPKARVPPPLPQKPTTPPSNVGNHNQFGSKKGEETNFLSEIQAASAKRMLRHVSVGEKGSESGSGCHVLICNGLGMRSELGDASASRNSPNHSTTTSKFSNTASFSPSQTISTNKDFSNFSTPSQTTSTNKDSLHFSTPSQNTSTNINSSKVNPTSHTSSTNSTSWEERFTVDQVPYYYNTALDTLSWDKPDCLLTEKERQEGKRKWVWIENEQDGWIPLCVESESGSKVSGYTDNGSFVTTSKVAGGVHWNSLHELPNDIVLLEDCDEPSILYTIKQRYLKNQIYTWVGSNKSILVSINPFQQLPLYTPEVIQEHAHPPPNKQLLPHVYDIAYSAYNELSYNNTNQSILISGESGAGKTEATKQCLGFIAEIAGSDTSLEQKILQTNPILEAFGNAKTVRNNNSSRFGKWIEVHFNDRNKICGASIECYLLEKSRVVTQQENERNFHIFYQLFTSPDTCRQYNLGSIESYRYLTQGHCLTVNGLSDEQQFMDTLSSFEALNFSKQEIDSILSLLVGILKLGNIQFVESGKNSMHPEAKVQNPQLLAEVAEMLSIPEKDLEETICIRKITVREGFGENTTCIPLSCKEAIQNCDALAKELYSRLFDWIVMKLNQSLNGERNKFIGFLDIFGFEIFKTNSFEQLCINYANERLQKLFNNSTFKEEETVYRSEGIQFNHIQYSDNEQVLDMLENRYGGLFCAIDDQVKMRSGNDTNLIKNIRNTLTKYSCFDGNAKATNQFGIEHYAGCVTYTIDGFTDKNRDRIYDNLYTLIASSSSTFISTLFPQLANQGKTTVCAKFQKQLNDLVCILEASDRKYIRCIKPNDQKKKLSFDNVHSLEQLRYSGIFEAVKIRKVGYPFRLTFDQFVHRYRCLPMVKSISIPQHSSTTNIIELIIKARPECQNKVFIGRTLVLYKATEHKILELARNLALDRLLPTLQCMFKCKLARIALPLYDRIEKELSKALDSKQLEVIESALAENEHRIQQVQQLISKTTPLTKKAQDAVVFLKRISELEERLQTLLKGPLTTNMTPLMNTIEEIESQPDLISNHLMSVIEEARTRIRQFAASLIEPDLREALYSLERSQIEKLVAQSDQLSYVSDTVREGKRLLALADEEFFQLEIERAEQFGDISRLVDRKIKLRDLLLHKNEDKYLFTRYSGLKTPEEYASHKILTMNRKWWRDTAFSFISLVIPTCLTTISKDFDKKGITIFKTIQGYMKDRKYNVEPNQLVFEIIQSLNKPKYPASLRTEVYCQLMKQLTDNPNSMSVSLGWDLMAIFLYYILPEEHFINYVIIFIWKNCKEPEKFINVLNNSYYSSKYKRDGSYTDGCRKMPSTPQEIEEFLSDFTVNSRRYSIETKLASYGNSFDRKSSIASQGTIVRSSSPRSSVVFSTGTLRKPRGPAPAAPPPPKPKKETAIVLYDITLDINPNVLVCKEGDQIVIEEDFGDWLRATFNGEEGFVPYNYIQRGV